MLNYYRKIKRSGSFKRKVKLAVHELQEHRTKETIYSPLQGNIPLGSVELESHHQIIAQNDTNSDENHQAIEFKAHEINRDDGYVHVETSLSDHQIIAQNNTNSEENHQVIDFHAHQINRDDGYVHDQTSLSEENALNFQRGLKAWCTHFNVGKTCLNELLKLCNNTLPITLPRDSRTILQTPASITLTQVDDNGGQYWHNGIEKCIRSVFDHIDSSKTYSINVSVDGLPIYASSTEEFWPILFNIYELKEIPPMLIGIYCGKGKPTNLNAFLRNFVDEIKNIMEHGILFGAQRIAIKIRCFICDTPARALIKGCAYFNSKHGCQKCCVVGEFSYKSNTTIFPNINAGKRTDNGFRNKLYSGHQRENTPLTVLICGVFIILYCIISSIIISSVVYL